MYVIAEQRQPNQWLACVRLETANGWRAFQAWGDSRVGALMALHHAMWRYRGAEYEAARRAVVSAAARPSAAVPSLVEFYTTPGRRVGAAQTRPRRRIERCGCYRVA